MTLFGLLDTLIEALDPTAEDFANEVRRLEHVKMAKNLIAQYPILLEMHSQTVGNMKVTPLIAALMTNSHRCTPELFTLLTAAPCNLNAAKNCGRTAVHFLALHNHVPFLKQLLSNNRQTINVNATTNTENYTPVYMAALKACHEAVALLVSNGADVNIANAEQQSPLHMACFFGQTQGGVFNPHLTKELAHQYLTTMQILLASGAYVNVGDKLKKTPLYYFSEVVFPPNLEYIRKIGLRLLLKSGAKLQAKSDEGYTPEKVAKHHGFQAFAAKLHESRIPSLQQLCLKKLIEENADSEIPVEELALQAKSLKLGQGK